MTKHVPLFLPLGSIRLLTIFFSFCIIFVHPALADKMAESPELFDTAFTLQERLDIPDGFVQREMVYISILLGTLVLCLFFFFMQRRMKKLRERDRERYLQLLEGILDNLPIAAKVKDVNDGMRYTFWNKKAEELFECSAREAIGKTDFETMPEAAALIRKEDEELVKTGIPQEGIRRFFTKKNEERFTFQNNNFIKLSDGRKWIVYTAWDITDLKIMERKLRLAKEEAEESNRIKSAFLANMSHEIRTPLNAIVGFSEIIALTEDEKEKEEYLGIIQQNSNLLLQLINDILDLSRIESGKSEMHCQLTEMSGLVDEVDKVHRLKMKKGVKLNVIRPSEEIWISTDRNRVTQVLFNFLSNAIKNTIEGSITFGLVKEEEWVKLYVTDTGCGISKEKLPLIFTRFEKLNDFVQGTGLGLPICKSIVERLGGRIEVESELGQGSTFILYLPNRQVQEVVVGERENAAGNMGVENRQKKILIAEDVESSYLQINAFLKKEYTILWVPNGEEAVKSFIREKPDLILMDIRMPVMNGIQATAKIRAISQEIPIIAITAYAFCPEGERALEAGCNEVIAKPYPLEKLKETIETYL